MNTHRFRALTLVAIVSFLGACELQLEQLTVAPPGSVGEVETDCDLIEVSRGVAFGIACTAPNGPCEGIEVSVADATIADAFVAYSTEFVATFSDLSDDQATSFVVVGKRAGETEVTVDSNEGSLTYAVRVLAND